MSKKHDTPLIADLRQRAKFLYKDLHGEDAARQLDAAHAFCCVHSLQKLSPSGDGIPDPHVIVAAGDQVRYGHALDAVAHPYYGSWQELIENQAARVHLEWGWEEARHARGDLDIAYGRALEAVAADPDCVDAYALQGYVLTGKEAWEEAAAAYERGISAAARNGIRLDDPTPGHFGWYSTEIRPVLHCVDGVARSHLRRGDRREAVRWTRRLLRMNPSDQHAARHLLVLTLFDLGNYRGVRTALIRHFRRPWMRREAFRAWMSLCVAAADGDDPTDAARALVASQPRDVFVVLQACRLPHGLAGAAARRWLPGSTAARLEAALRVKQVLPALAATATALRVLHPAWHEALRRARRTGVPLTAPAPPGAPEPQERAQEARYRSTLRYLRTHGLRPTA